MVVVTVLVLVAVLVRVLVVTVTVVTLEWCTGHDEPGALLGASLNRLTWLEVQNIP